MFKSILSTFAFIGFIGATTVPVLAVNSVAETNDRAGMSLDVVANPEQTKFSVPSAKLELDPNLLSKGQRFKVTVPVSNEANKTKVKITASHRNRPDWLEITDPTETTIDANGKANMVYIFKVNTIPPRASSAEIYLDLDGKKEVVDVANPKF